MATLKRIRLLRSERGAELIEMAIVTPLLLLLVFGIVDFGFMFQRYVVLTNAAVEGARVASLPGYTLADRADPGHVVRRQRPPGWCGRNSRRHRRVTVPGPGGTHLAGDAGHASPMSIRCSMSPRS